MILIIKLQRKLLLEELIIWKYSHVYYGLRDAYSHQGSSFQTGHINNDTITCPYHGYIFNGICGKLIKIPKVNIIQKDCYNVDSFKVDEKYGIVFMNTISITL